MCAAPEGRGRLRTAHRFNFGNGAFCMCTVRAHERVHFVARLFRLDTGKLHPRAALGAGRPDNRIRMKSGWPIKCHATLPLAR